MEGIDERQKNLGEDRKIVAEASKGGGGLVGLQRGK
jgi:hypothetical protein